MQNILFRGRNLYFFQFFFIFLCRIYTIDEHNCVNEHFFEFSNDTFFQRIAWICLLRICLLRRHLIIHPFSCRNYHWTCWLNRWNVRHYVFLSNKWHDDICRKIRMDLKFQGIKDDSKIMIASCENRAKLVAAFELKQIKLVLIKCQ